MSNFRTARAYRSFLLRLWAETDDDALCWRFSLDDPHAGTRQGFANFKELASFLEEVMKQNEPRHAPSDPAVDGGEGREVYP